MVFCIPLKKKIARFSGKINCINCSRRCNLRVATRKSTISQGPKKLKHVDVRSEKVDSDGGTCLSFCGRVNTCFFSEWRKNIFRLSRKQKCSTAGISLGSVGRTVQNKLRIQVDKELSSMLLTLKKRFILPYSLIYKITNDYTF